MPALRKPHRVAFLLPEVTLDGSDAAFAQEAALLLWTACIEVCQRHPQLAVYDAESTPPTPHEGHFAPLHATVGATPTDAFYSTARRDELVWLELVAKRASSPSSGVVRLHTLGRDGAKASFEAVGRNLGEQLQQVLGAWIAARGLGPLPRKLESCTLDELLASIRVLGPVLIEQARTGAPSAQRTLPNRLPGPLKLHALRLLQLVGHEDLGELMLAIDPAQPQALFAQFKSALATGRDFALLRRVIASAPCWAKPYAELVTADEVQGSAPGPSELESVAGAGIAAMCRPANLEILETAADLLDDCGLVDQGVRLLERALATHDHDSAAHQALLRLHAQTDREGARLAQAQRSSSLHGCPMDALLPWYPDQIQIDLYVSDALFAVGRLDEAIALRANRLEGREAAWPRMSEVLTAWKKDPGLVARSFAREGHYRGDPARVVEGFGRVEPADDVDVAVLLEALVAMGREDEVSLAWAQFGHGAGNDGPVARLAAAHALLAAGEWRRGLEELWHVELAEPQRDEHVAIARCGLLLSAAPIEVCEAALGDRVAIGASTLARRMARDIADFVPAAGKSAIVARALGQTAKTAPIDFDPASLASFPSSIPGKQAIDALFARVGPLKGDDALARSDRLVNGWLEVVFTDASDQDPAALVQAAVYLAAQALGRYLAATTHPASPVAGALRTVAGEALALVRRHRAALGDREVRGLLATIDPLLRRVDRWIGSTWLDTVERACAIDERTAGDIAAYARDYATVAARILGPEESAVLAASVAVLHRDRPVGWAGAVAAQAARLAAHTGYLGADEWAEAVVTQLAAREIDTDDAIDALHTACYLVEGVSPVPAVHAARVLLGAGRAPAALAVLSTGLGAAEPAWRARELATLADAWGQVKLDIPLAFDKVAAAMFDSLQKGDAVRAEKLGRWAVALDPTNSEAHRNLGLAFAQQGKVPEAMRHLVKGTPAQATQILSGTLHQAGKVAQAMTVLDYASRWYVRADQWLTYGGVAYAALDNARTVRAYALAYALDPEAFDASQLNAYAGVLDEVGDYATCRAIATHLRRVAGDDVMWQTSAWNHEACALIGLGKFDEAIELAERAVKDNPLPANAAGFAATLERARARTAPVPAAAPAPAKPRELVFSLLEAGDFATAAALVKDASWRVRRAALEATRFRFSSEDDVEVTPRARSTMNAVLADTVGSLDREAVLARAVALRMREQAELARDPVPRLGDRMTRDAFYQELRARGGVVVGEGAPPPPVFKDRVVLPSSKVSSVSDYVSLLRDLAALTPREALAQFDLDDAGYLEVAKAWAAALDADPSLARAIAAGLAKR